MRALTARQLKQAILIDLATGLVPNIIGSPGIGKSAMLNSVADDLNLELAVEFLNSKEPTDINGMPDLSGDYAVFKTFINFPTEEMELPKGKNGWLLFLDELNSASIETQAAAYSLILDRKVGRKKLHPKCFIVAAGNKKSDGAIVNRQSSAMISRMVNYEMAINSQEFLEDIVLGHNWDEMVAAYLHLKPEFCHQFDPNKAEEPQPCPRTWDFLQRRIQTMKANNFTLEEIIDIPQLASAEGLISQPIAREFFAFIRTFGQIPSLDDVVLDPIGLALPNTRGLQFATVLSLRKQTSMNEIDQVKHYIQRFNPEFRVLFWSDLIQRLQLPKHHPLVTEAATQLRKTP